MPPQLSESEAPTDYASHWLHSWAARVLVLVVFEASGAPKTGGMLMKPSILPLTTQVAQRLPSD